jgi:molybdopterin/thiamine biosynthesis adenylyltransferase
MTMAGADDAASEARPQFSYDYAFSRNVGWITEAEQQILRQKRIAIAGCGGVGGSHLLTLTRLGIGAFHIADFDKFELANFNRQAGATLSSLGKPKAATMAAMARDINPTLDLKLFPDGIDEANLDAFLAGVDVYVDSLDFFVLELRRKIFARCAELGIPALTAAPLGMGTAYLVFMPGKMSFDRYFRLDRLSPERQAVNYALGVAPRGYHRGYLMDPSRLDLKGERGPSTSLACELCAGVAATEVLRLLLQRGRVRAAPWYHHFDAYRCRLKRGYLPGGNGNPLQRAKLAIAYRVSRRLSANAYPKAANPTTQSDLEYVLDLARWAPSGDNQQPWRFEIVSPASLVVRITPSAGDVFDYRDHEPTLLAAGMLLECMKIAATARQRSMHWRYLGGESGTYSIAVELPRAPQVLSDPLLPYITIRCVDRRPYRASPLSDTEKAALEAALGEELSIVWHESLAGRWSQAAINALAADIRLRLRSVYEMHRRVLDFDRDFSPTGIPARSVGLDPLARSLMRTLLKDWRRVDLMNRYPGGTLLARLEMDLIPGLLCAAHFDLRSKDPRSRAQPETRLRMGAAIQRFWLTATRLGLAMQPGFAALVFAESSRRGSVGEVGDRGLGHKAAAVAKSLGAAEAGGADLLVFRGRIGRPRSRRVVARSVRRSLEELCVRAAHADVAAASYDRKT